LPILFLVIRPKDPVRNTAVRFTLTSDKETPDSVPVFSNYFVRDHLKNKKVVSVEINGQENFDDIDSYISGSKFSFIHNEIQRLQFTHDTSMVLKIVLGYGTNYGDFAWLLNQMMLSQVKWYALMNDSFYVLANPPPITDDQHYQIEPFELDTAFIRNYESPTKWDLLKWKLEHKLEELIAEIKYSPTISVGFAVLVFIPSAVRIRRLIKTGCP